MPRRVAIAAEIDQDVDAEFACLQRKRLVVHRIDIVPLAREGAEAAGHPVMRAVLRQADDCERRGIQRLEAGDRQPADRMRLQRTRQQADDERTIGIARVGERRQALARQPVASSP